MDHSGAEQGEPSGPQTQLLQRILRQAAGLERDDRTPLAVHLGMQIGSEIITGSIRPGEEIPAAVIAQRFHTSRTPVREALIMLERIGLVQMRARRRPRVTLLPRQEISEIYELRELLYGAVAHKVVHAASNQDLMRLEPHLARMRIAADAGNADAFFWEKADLHEAIVGLAADGTVAQMIELLGVRVMQFGRLGVENPEDLLDSFRDYERLSLAFTNREASLAHALFTGAVRGARDRLLARYDVEFAAGIADQDERGNTRG